MLVIPGFFSMSYGKHTISSFLDLALLLNKIYLIFIHVVQINNLFSIVWLYTYHLFIHSPLRHLGGFPFFFFFAIMNKLAVYICIQVFVWTYIHLNKYRVGGNAEFTVKCLCNFVISDQIFPRFLYHVAVSSEVSFCCSNLVPVTSSPAFGAVVCF